MRKTMVNRARARKRLAVRLILLANPNCRVKVSPINIVPRKARSYGVIWKLYEIKWFYCFNPCSKLQTYWYITNSVLMTQIIAT